MVPGTRTKKLRILQNRCLTGNQEPNQEVQALISWVDQEVIGLTRIFLAFYKKLLFFYQDNRVNYDVLNVFLDVQLYLCLKNHIDVFLDVLNNSLTLNKIRAKSMCEHYDKISMGWGLVPKGGEYKDNFQQAGG